MYSAKKSHPAPVGNSPYKLSPYKTFASSCDRVAINESGAMDSRTPSSKPNSMNPSRFLEVNSSVKPMPQLNIPKIKIQDQDIKPLARKPPPVYNPKISDSSFGLKRDTCQQTTSCPGPVVVENVNQPKLPPKSIKHKKSTTSLKKHHGFSVNAKGAFDRFIKSAKRNLTLDSSFSSSKTNQQNKKSKLTTSTKKLIISYPKRIQSPDFDFLKTPRYEIQEIQPKVELRRCSSTSGNLNSKIKSSILNRNQSTIKRSQTCAKRVLNLNQFSKSNKSSKLKVVEPIKLISIPENEEIPIPKPLSFSSENEKSQDELTLCGTDNKSNETIIGEIKDHQVSSQVSPLIEEIGLAMLPEVNGSKDLTSRRNSIQDQDEKYSRRPSMKKDAENKALVQVSPPWKMIPLKNDNELSPNPLSIPLPTTPRSRFSILESSIQSFTPTSNQESNNYYKTKIIEKTTYIPPSGSNFSLKKPLIQLSNSIDHQKNYHYQRPLIKKPSVSPTSRFSGISTYSQTSESKEEIIEEDISLTLMGCGSSYTPYNLEKFYSNMSSTTNTTNITNITNPSCISDNEIDEKKSNLSDLEEKGKLNCLNLDLNQVVEEEGSAKRRKVAETGGNGSAGTTEMMNIPSGPRALQNQSHHSQHQHSHQRSTNNGNTRIGINNGSIPMNRTDQSQEIILIDKGGNMITEPKKNISIRGMAANALQKANEDNARKDHRKDSATSIPSSATIMDGGGTLLARMTDETKNAEDSSNGKRKGGTATITTEDQENGRRRKGSGVVVEKRRDRSRDKGERGERERGERGDKERDRGERSERGDRDRSDRGDKDRDRDRDRSKKSSRH